MRINNRELVLHISKVQQAVTSGDLAPGLWEDGKIFRGPRFLNEVFSEKN